jgi:ATP-dependent RNA helicase DDX42
MVLPSQPAKCQWLVEMLPILSPLGRCLVFVSTRAECDNLCRIVEVSCSWGGDADGGGAAATIVSIHGDKDQRDRNSAISTFKKNARAILIATDVAARGLDIPDVMVVVNFDAAKNLDAHVHRVGRAGRLQKGAAGDGTTAGEGQQKQHHQRGVAYTLLTEKDVNFAASLADAFDREGREVSSELALLCQKSNRYGGGRVKHSKVGLGFGAMGNAVSNTGTAAQASHYGPSPSPNQLARKRSRWS